MNIYPAISIVLPTYNGERYLAESIQSVLEQTITDWELIIVDDYSTDRSAEIIREFAERDKRIRVIRNAENLRLPASLNEGFKSARGEFLTWTSDDNRYRENALERMLAALHTHPEASVVYADYTQIGESGEEIRAMRLEEPEWLAIGNIVRACFVYRREVQEKLGGYRVDMFTAEDYDFWIRASIHYKFMHIAEDLYEYRLHGGSLTSRHESLIRQCHESTLRDNLPRMRWLKPEMRAKGYLKLAALAKGRGGRTRMIRDYLRAILAHPAVALNIHSIRSLIKAPRGQDMNTPEGSNRA